MSDNQTNQPAMASRHRRKSSLEVGYPTTIRVHLTDLLPLGEGLDDNSRKEWVNFWSKLTTNERWCAVTSYSFFLSTSTVSKDKQREHPVLLVRPSSCNNPEEAEKKTKDAQEILTALGFNMEPDGKDIVTMRWGYPDREWVKRTMPGLIKDIPGKLEDSTGNLWCADVEWIDHIKWEKYGIAVSEAKRKLGTDQGEEEREGKKAKFEDV